MITQLAPRKIRKLWRRFLHQHRDTINTVLIAIVFVLAGAFAASKLIP